MTNAVIIGDESLWAGGHPPGHPLRPGRLRDTWQMLQAYNAFEPPNVKVLPPRPPTDRELRMFHTRQYIEAVRQLSAGKKVGNPTRYGFGTGDNPVFAGMFESEGLKVGGGLVAAEQLLTQQADVAFNFAGGLHHAGPDFASGFCVFGDGAIAIHKFLSRDWRVAYIDIDAHHGDGVQNAFYDDPRVLTISFHESGLYLFPGTGFVRELGEGEGHGYSVNVPLLPYTDDEAFVWAFEEIVPPLLSRFEPNVIVAQLGVDAHWRDPLTHICLTTHGFETLIQRIHELSPRWLAVGGGGYEPAVVPRVWTLAWGIMSGQTFDNSLPPAVNNDWERNHLHDNDPAPITPEQQQQAFKEAQKVVGKLKEKLDLG